MLKYELSLGFSEGVKFLIEHSPTGYFLLMWGGELWIKSWVVGHQLYKIRWYVRIDLSSIKVCIVI